MRKILTFALTLVFGYGYAQDVNVIGFNGEVHSGGSTISKTVDFPTDLSGFSQILMNVSLGCPAGGCDPWDRYAELRVVTDQGADIEIGRFITPYGNDNCGWTIDVSEYRQFLTGQTEIVSHIDTWNNGWELYTDFDFIEGIPEFEYINVTQLIKDNGFTYGDTIFYSIDIPDFDFDVPAEAEEVVFRVINTGHGQGNTENAAEFSQKTHGIYINGNQEFTQFLWKADCNQNPCSPQGGTWQFNRAGWCPGENVVPWDYDISSWATPGGTVNLDYVLEPFFNQCSPWNLDCEDGVTCAECTYNNNGHTTPHYKFALQVIVKSNTPLPLSLEEINEAGIRIFPNPTQGILNLALRDVESVDFSLINITGNEVLSGTLDQKYAQLHLAELSNGIYLLRLDSGLGQSTKRIIIDK